MLGVALVLAAVIDLVLMLVIVGRRTPGYSHIRQTISELGARGATHEKVVSRAVLLPVGALSLAVACLMWPTSAAAGVLAASLAIGSLVAAAFPYHLGSIRA